MRVLGIDGYKGGWVGVWLQDGAFARSLATKSLADLFALDSAEVVAIDMPIGIDVDRRPVDDAARKLLKGRASTLFRIPPRAVLSADSHSSACAAARELGLGWLPSQQAFHLGKKILELDAFLRERSKSTPRVYEAHPELAFAAIANRPVASKKTWNGLMDRVELLRSVGIRVPAALEEASDVPADDVLDAAVVAWVTARIGAKAARSVPEQAAPGACAIWY